LPRHLTLVPLLAVLYAHPTPAQELSQTETQLAAYVDEHFDDAVALLERVVNINSGTMNLEGVRQVGDIFRRELDALGLDTRWIDFDASVNRAGHLFARTSGRGSGRSVLLIGHLDTVFERDHPFQTFERTGRTATGPGTNDMKGGDVVMLLALQALRAAGVLSDADITVAMIGDEESPGEPLSVVRQDLIAAGQRVDAALGFEGGVQNGSQEFITVARRSASEWRLVVTGRQGHSSQVFSETSGAGAIFEAARILDDFYDEVRGERYLTFNAGTILGGTDVEYDFEETRGSAFGKTNVIPQRVVVHGGIRTISLDQLERARARMTAVVARHLPHTSAEITFTEGYPPMAPTDGNYALVEVFNEASLALGLGALETLDPGLRGAADISFVAPHTDALAGLGPIGQGAHAPGEGVDLESIRTAAKRAAVMIYRLTQAPPAM
jgi:glutamate carboxypeptidase